METSAYERNLALEDRMTAEGNERYHKAPNESIQK